jgi:hypothetical protein
VSLPDAEPALTRPARRRTEERRGVRGEPKASEALRLAGQNQMIPHVHAYIGKIHEMAVRRDAMPESGGRITRKVLKGSARNNGAMKGNATKVNR